MSWDYDKEMGIHTRYHISIEAVRIDFNDRWRPGVTFSLYKSVSRVSDKGYIILHAEEDCPKVFQWTSHQLQYLCRRDSIILYSNDGHKEQLATVEEADERASQAKYGRQNVARIAVTRTLYFGTSTVWFEVYRDRWYGTHPSSSPRLDVSLCLEFANEENCTRFIQQDMRSLEYKFGIKGDEETSIADILRSLVPITDTFHSAQTNAFRRRLTASQFFEECPQPDTKLIRDRACNRGHGRPCYLTLHLSISLRFSLSCIVCVDWSATTIPPTFLSSSAPFQSLTSLHLKFPSPTPQDHNNTSSSSSQSRPGGLTISISGHEISFSAGTSPLSLGSGFTLNSAHRTVNVNYINAIMGDAFLAPISGGNNGGRNNVNNSFGTGADEGPRALNHLTLSSSPFGSCTQGPNTNDTQSDQLLRPARKSISTYTRRFIRAIRYVIARST
ncbi:hypothetical protein AB1N83_007304 [Pleurotus pulmonarius]